MRINSTEKIPSKIKTNLLCSFVADGSNHDLDLDNMDPKLVKAIQQTIKEIKSAKDKIAIINTLEKIPAQRILLVGIDKNQFLINDSFRIASGRIAKKARDLGVSEFTIVVPKNKSPHQLILNQIIEGVKLSLYSFDKFKKQKKVKDPNLTLAIKPTRTTKKAIHEAEIISAAVNFTKDVANLPPNECVPNTLANIAKKLSSKNKLKCSVFSKTFLEKNGFGGITAVGQGSINEPKLIILEHKRGKPGQKPIVIVGKAVTFDTGGISLKPGDKMDEMKFDKCGGCAVLGIMKGVSELKLPMNIIGIIPSVENMPGGKSYRPGDIIRLYSGKTAEILNTDAEGRLILSDALSYGEKKYKPSKIIDLATLTGACIVALGNNVAGMVSNNQEFVNKIKKSSDNTSEAVWQLPIDEDYMEMIKSDVADMKNIGIGRAAGTITAAAFLQKAIKDTPWVHFDIAGVAWTQQATKGKPYKPKGATGFGVRLLLDYLANQN